MIREWWMRLWNRRTDDLVEDDRERFAEADDDLEPEDFGLDDDDLDDGLYDHDDYDDWDEEDDEDWDDDEDEEDFQPWGSWDDPDEDDEDEDDWDDEDEEDFVGTTADRADAVMYHYQNEDEFLAEYDWKSV